MFLTPCPGDTEGASATAPVKIRLYGTQACLLFVALMPFSVAICRNALQGSTAPLPLKTSIGSSLQRGQEDVSRASFVV